MYKTKNKYKFKNVGVALLGDPINEKNINKKIKQNSAITLIALVITIIVLLILAGLTLTFVLGENGLFGKARQAKLATLQAQAEEDVRLKILEYQTANDGEEPTLNQLATYLGNLATEEYLIKTSTSVSRLKEGSVSLSSIDNSTNEIYVTKTTIGAEVKVTKNLQVEATNKVETASPGGTSSGSSSSGTSGGSSSATANTLFGITISSTEGNGTENSPYLIKTKEQLEYFSFLVNNGNTFEGKYIKLDNNILLDSTKQWTPIGKPKAKFLGTFDGAGYTISGIYINSSSTYQGLFGCIGQTAVVKRIKLEGNISGSSHTGGIVGHNSGGTISNCINYAKCSSYDSTKEIWTIGGICGCNLDNGTIYQCANYAEIKGYGEIGGIVGQQRSGVIKECYNVGKIEGQHSSGGIIGEGYNGTAYIFNCYNNATVTSNNYNAGIDGGCCGDDITTTFSIYNSYTIKNTTIYGEPYNATVNSVNTYTTNANTKIDELNAGIDEVGASTSTVSPWVADTNNINGGYPILSWQ